MIGQSPEMQIVFDTMQKVATSDAFVLIQGERGTGKELVARELHAMSLRKAGAFVHIDCGSISETEFDSVLYGNEKQKLIGKNENVQAKMEYVNDRTVFIDEIEKLPSLLQLKLLRFLEDKTFQQIGGRENIVLTTRIITSTCNDLLKEIGAGKFREDLYYRLGVVLIKIPPLRERKGDIASLSTYFLNRYCELNNKRLRGFSAAAFKSMEAYAWPGNVQELENKIQSAVILSEGPLIEPYNLGLGEKVTILKSSNPIVETLKDAKDRVEKEMVISALDRNAGNIAKASEELGISRPTLYDLMKKLGLYKSALQEEKGNNDSRLG